MSIKKLLPLSGVWVGKGLAEYPTIEKAEYSEELVFQANELFPVIHYEQKTWVKSEDGLFTKPIFWESGFIIEKENALLELCNVQKGGRMEILSGIIKEDPNTGFEIVFESVNIFNDEKTVRSGRKFIFYENTLKYELYMSTKKNFSFDLHLRANLSKQASK